MAVVYEADSAAAIVFGHERLEISGRLVLRLSLARSPLHKKAVAEASEHTHDPNPIGVAEATSILVVGHIQALLGAVFDSPGKAIELEPEWTGSQAGPC